MEETIEKRPIGNPDAGQPVSNGILPQTRDEVTAFPLKTLGLLRVRVHSIGLPNDRITTPECVFN